MSSPSTRASPDVERSRPSSIRIVVVFPDPLGPRKPNTEPRGTARSMPSTAVCAPKRLVSPTVCTARPSSDEPAVSAVVTDSAAGLGGLDETVGRHGADEHASVVGEHDAEE